MNKMDMRFESQEEKEKSTVSSGLIVFLTVFWIATGIAAFIMSLMCFGSSGSMTDKIFGFLLALFFGPFYWIYFMVMKKYCKKN